MDDNKKIKVMNRTNGTVGYTIPDMGNLYREYTAKEEKIITFEELRKLSYVTGGETILKEYLIVKDEEALKELNLNIEPEYFYTEEEVKNLILTGTQDEFLDCLDFAPEGVIDLIKELAVKLPMNDVQKRQAVLAKTGFDVTKAIEIELYSKEEEEIPTTTGRRAAVPSKDGKDQSASQTIRRVVEIKETK